MWSRVGTTCQLSKVNIVRTPARPCAGFPLKTTLLSGEIHDFPANHLLWSLSETHDETSALPCSKQKVICLRRYNHFVCSRPNSTEEFNCQSSARQTTITSVSPRNQWIGKVRWAHEVSTPHQRNTFRSADRSAAKGKRVQQTSSKTALRSNVFEPDQETMIVQ